MLSLNCGMYTSNATDLYERHLSHRSLDALRVLFRFVTLRLTLKLSEVSSAKTWPGMPETVCLRLRFRLAVRVVSSGVELSSGC